MVLKLNWQRESTSKKYTGAGDYCLVSDFEIYTKCVKFLDNTLIYGFVVRNEKKNIHYESPMIYSSKELAQKGCETAFDLILNVELTYYQKALDELSS